MGEESKEPIAVFGKMKFLRLTNDLWVRVQCEEFDYDTWGIVAKPQGDYVMFKIMKCGSIVYIRLMDMSEIAALNSLTPKLMWGQ